MPLAEEATCRTGTQASLVAFGATFPSARSIFPGGRPPEPPGAGFARGGEVNALRLVAVFGHPHSRRNDSGASQREEQELGVAA